MAGEDVPQGAVWCPTCKRVVEAPAANVLVSYSSVGLTLHPNGELDWGDAFLDYEHADCGTSVRMLAHRTWNDDVFEYVFTNSVDLEVYRDGKMIILDGVGVDGMGDLGIDEVPRYFSGNVKDDLETWDGTLQFMLRSLSYALDHLRVVSKGVVE